MPTTITQLEDAERGKTVLRVAGSMAQEDAVLLEKIALGLRADIQKNLTLDFADLHFLDSDAAPILLRLEREHNFEIEGVEYFLQRVVDETEKPKN
ncbi:MAG: hypothetical protein H0U87_06225 [Acidobacteria bacterium]|jgi:anti-anti-sigma regulatory factor|nr:hypothetical protein [Acidobacteriota bacterium]